MVAMSTLPRAYKSESSMGHGTHSLAPNGHSQAGAAVPVHKSKKSKRLSWTLGRKKSRDEPYVADGSGKNVYCPVGYT